LTAKKAVDNLTNVEGEWKEKTDELMRRIESLQVHKVATQLRLLFYRNHSGKFMSIIGEVEWDYGMHLPPHPPPPLHLLAIWIYHFEIENRKFSKAALHFTST
jgi:hypothetical protein